MSTLIDIPAFAANEIYRIEATDRVEGAADGASFSGLGISNEPHQQLANRTALLKQRQDNNIAAIGVLQAFAAKFAGSLQTNGYIKIPLSDVTRGAVTAIIEWGYYSLSAQKIPNDVTLSVTWPLAFPNAILAPPLATNVYHSTSGFNVAAAVISYTKTGATFVLDVPGGTTLGTTSERSNGFSWLAIGF
ncbi:MAG: gp53-like domain-containing protein [Candidatus Binataceae bacterium]